MTEEQIKSINESGYNIKFISNPSEELQLLAVRQTSCAIKFIENPSEKVKLESVRCNGYSLRHIKDPTEEIMREAINEDAYAISMIKEPSEELQLLAINKDVYVIQYIKNPTEKVQNEAEKHRPVVLPQNVDITGYIKINLEDARTGLAIVTVPAEARRSSAFSRVCRAEYVKIDKLYPTIFPFDFLKYITLKAPTWDDRWWFECGGGIKFFITEEDAHRNS